MFKTLIPQWGDMDRWFSDLLQCGTLMTSLAFHQLLLLLLAFLFFKAFLRDGRWGLFSFGNHLCIKPLTTLLLVSTLLTMTIFDGSFLYHTIPSANAFVALTRQ